jgi:AraC-like DNA-binding protein
MNVEDLARLKDTEVVRGRMAKRILTALNGADELSTDVEGLTVIQRTKPVPATSYLYKPSLAMIIHGRKNILIGGKGYHYDESMFFLTSVDLPTITEVVRATPEKPYVSILLNLDLDAVREVVTEIELDDVSSCGGSAQAFGPADRSLFEAMERLVALALSPRTTKFLADLGKRELVYRLLTGPVGEQLRRTATLGTGGNKASLAVAWLREHYAEPLRINDLASRCGMADSTLHQRFRALTSMSPLQYQKQLRLHEARRLLLSEDIDANTTAMRVGYESVTQFNREYKRAFGAPPRRDVILIKQSASR